jgi:hypothetical protein
MKFIRNIFICLFILSIQTSFWCQQACSITMEGKEFSFPMKVEYAVKNLDFKYNYEWKVFEGRLPPKENWFNFYMLIFRKEKSFTISDWFKKEEDFFNESVIGCRGTARGTNLDETMSQMEELYHIKFSEKKSFQNDGGSIFEYTLARLDDCLWVALYINPEFIKDAKYINTNFLILYGVGENEIESFFS